MPPLVVRLTEHGVGDERPYLDSVMLEAEEMLATSDVDRAVAEQRKFDLAVQLANQYKALLAHWQMGDSVLEWIRQCEITFGARLELRNLLRPDVWPHAGRSSFVLLLEDKAIPAEGVEFEKAVGMRLTFRQPPPLSCFSNQFLFYLNSSVATTAFETWAHMSPAPLSCLPPERFTFDIIDMS